ncbi:hypothetical protein VTJ49DRAFT_1394 [Mycothermus thermophilus]|uniref:Derlin n=1 Tax=Humicola insolens TaxID=85995 RepID=A0ABR3VCK3_HUMIN
MSELMDAYLAQPPIARTLTTAVFVTSVSVHLLGWLPATWLYFDTEFLFRFPPEIWRLVTSFLLSDPQLGIIMDSYFVFQYLKQVETANPKFTTKEDVVWYLMTVGSFIIFINRVILGSGAFFLPGLIMALTYTACQDQRGAQAGFFFFTVPAQTVPYCMILMSFLMRPWIIPMQISGIVAAHLHDFLWRLWPEFGGGPRILATPSFVSYLVQTPRNLNRGYGTAIRPSGSGAGTGRTTGASTGSVLPDSWKTRGAGHRLGGD